MVKLPDFKPMPEEEEDALMDKVGDILENGGRMPQEVTNELLWAQGARIHRLLMSTRTQVRINSSGVKWLGAAVALIVAIIGIAHGGEVLNILAAIP